MTMVEKQDQQQQQQQQHYNNNNNSSSSTEQRSSSSSNNSNNSDNPLVCFFKNRIRSNNKRKKRRRSYLRLLLFSLSIFALIGYWSINGNYYSMQQQQQLEQNDEEIIRPSNIAAVTVQQRQQRQQQQQQQQQHDDDDDGDSGSNNSTIAVNNINANNNENNNNDDIKTHSSTLLKNNEINDDVIIDDDNNDDKKTGDFPRTSSPHAKKEENEAKKRKDDRTNHDTSISLLISFWAEEEVGQLQQQPNNNNKTNNNTVPSNSNHPPSTTTLSNMNITKTTNRKKKNKNKKKNENKNKLSHRIEIEAAIITNLDNSYLTQFVVILDSITNTSNCTHFVSRILQLYNASTVKRHAKPVPILTCIDHPNGQPNYYEIFNYTQHPSVVGRVVIVSNADHVFDDTIQLATNIKPNTIMVISSSGYHTTTPTVETFPHRPFPLNYKRLSTELQNGPLVPTYMRNHYRSSLLLQQQQQPQQQQQQQQQQNVQNDNNNNNNNMDEDEDGGGDQILQKQNMWMDKIEQMNLCPNRCLSFRKVKVYGLVPYSWDSYIFDKRLLSSQFQLGKNNNNNNNNNTNVFFQRQTFQRDYRSHDEENVHNYYFNEGCAEFAAMHDLLQSVVQIVDDDGDDTDDRNGNFTLDNPIKDIIHNAEVALVNGSLSFASLSSPIWTKENNHLWIKPRSKNLLTGQIILPFGRGTVNVVNGCRFIHSFHFHFAPKMHKMKKMINKKKLKQWGLSKNTNNNSSAASEMPMLDTEVPQPHFVPKLCKNFSSCQSLFYP